MAFIDSMMIMIRPMIGQYLKPLEENGTIERMQSQIKLIADRDAIPELAEMIEHIREHNALLREIRDERRGQYNCGRCLELNAVEPGPDPAATGHVGHDGNGMLKPVGAD